MPKQPRVVQVTGSGQAGAVPDVVRLSLGVTCDGKDVSSALRDAGRRVRAVGEAVREQGVQDTDIGSTGAGVHPRYDRDGQRVVGYQAVHRLGVVVRDLDRVGPVVDSVCAAAGNALSVEAIQLDLSDASAVRAGARTAAFREAEAKARQYAALSGATLGPVVSVVEGTLSAPQPRPVMRMAMASSESAMPVEAGEQQVTASVTVTWRLQPPAAGEAAE